MKFFIKAAITVLLFILISKNVDISATMEAASDITLSALFLALGFQFASTCVATVRWSLIMSKIGFEQPFSFYLKSYFKGTFFNQGLPTSIGGDSLRILDAARVTSTKEDAVFGVFIDRMIGLSGLLILNGAALLKSHGIIPQPIYLPLMGIITASCMAMIILYYLHHLPLLRKHKVLEYIARFSKRYTDVYSSPGSISLQVGLSIITHLFAMMAFFILGTGVGMTYPLPVYLALVPPVILLTILPISLAGWGIREGAMVGFFLLVGADKASVLSFSILYGLLALAASLPGLLVFLMQKNRL